MATTRTTRGGTRKIDVLQNGAVVKTLDPERRAYKASRQPTSEVAIWRRLNEDVYLNFAGSAEGSNKAVIQAYVFPLVSWIWIGFWVLFSGTIICLIPSKVRLQYARTQVVGVTSKAICCSAKVGCCLLLALAGICLPQTATQYCHTRNPARRRQTRV